MSRLARLPLLLLGFAALMSAVGACQALAGIDERQNGPSAECQKYCSLAKEVCTGTSALYASDRTCFGTCALLPPGSLDEPTGDTLACRENQLILAQQTNEPTAAAQYCAKAGPATNGACASNCESYCLLFPLACTAQVKPDACLTKCKGLVDTQSFDVNGNYYGDTLQCRLVHISAATELPAVHCPHAGLQAAGPCLGQDPTTLKPDCPSFCQLEMTACTGEQAVFESLDQCTNVCGALPLGTVDQQSGNTVACRKYHSYNALLDVTHCPHTGPGGDGLCESSAVSSTGSGNCESYCMLLESACKTEFDAAFTDQSACEADCSKLSGAPNMSGYSVAATGDNVQCRLLHVSRALGDDKECGAAMGDAPCHS